MGCRRMNLRIFFLTTKNVEQNGGPERMTYKANLAFEGWITLSEEVVNTIRFSKNNVADMLPIRALVKEYIQG